MIYVILALLGLCLGSFVNALVWRVHMQAKLAKAAKKPSKAKLGYDPADLSVLFGRSMCTNCHHALAWYDLVPLLSWLSLRGKCRYCHKSISWQYPLVEVLTAGLFIVSYGYFPLFSYTFSTSHIILFAMWLIIVTAFVALMVYDLRWMLLPDRIVIPLQLLAALYVIIELIVLPGRLGTLRGAGLGVIFSAGVFYMLYSVSKGRWIGGGDVKLALALGLLLGGAFEAVLMLFIASVLGSLVGIPLLLGKKTKLNSKLPFGPFLVIATFVVFLFGAGIIAWYKRQFLIA